MTVPRAFAMSLALAVSSTFGAPPPPQPVPGAAVVFGDNVNVRDQASAQGNVKWKARIGQAVSLVTQGGVFTQNKTSDYWYGVEAGDRTGFIWGALLSDAATNISGHQVLARVAGTLRDQVEIRIVSNQQHVGTALWKCGPVADARQMAILPFSGEGFSHPPAFFFSVACPIKSEIEGSQPLALFFSFTPGAPPKSHITWVPRFCDPPVCAETTPAFPTARIRFEIPPAPAATNAGEISRKKKSGTTNVPAPAKAFRTFSGESNAILLIDDHWEMGDHPTHDYQVRKIVWDGTNLMPVKMPPPPP